jgi:hypothetical protein
MRIHRFGLALSFVAFTTACGSDDGSGPDRDAATRDATHGRDEDAAVAGSNDGGRDRADGGRLPTDGGNAPTATFVERSGFVVMEAESASIPDGHEWEQRASHEGYTGEGYYTFLGNGICNGPPGSPLRYDFQVSSDSTYELRLHMTKTFHCVYGEARENGHCQSKSDCDRAGSPTASHECTEGGTCLRDDLSNDVFVHIEDAAGRYVAWVSQPADTVGNPIKLFVGGGSDDWRWTGTRNLDVSHDKWDAHWELSPGSYVLVVHGRSQLTRLDRIVLFDQVEHSFSGADALEMPETR